MWTYTQNSGQLAQDGKVAGTGYSGKGDGKNNPFAQNLEGVGPIPCGYYAATELIQNHPKLGSYVIHLEPDELTREQIESFGRQPDSFFMHGDSIDHPGEASDGCIIQSRPVRVQFWMSGDRALRVISGENIQPTVASEGNQETDS